MNKEIDDLTLSIYKDDVKVFEGLSRLRNIVINLSIIASGLPVEQRKMINAVTDNIGDNIEVLFDSTKNIKENVKRIAEINKEGEDNG